YEASVAGFAERYRRGETPHTVHVWWARRPHSAMRSLAFACLCKELSDDALNTMRDLSSVAVSQATLQAARRIIRRNFPEEPKVLDMFGGGGTIPFEAANLGARSYSIDSNELSVFVQKSVLVHAQSIEQNKLLQTLRESGNRVLERLAARTAALYPKRGET